LLIQSAKPSKELCYTKNMSDVRTWEEFEKRSHELNIRGLKNNKNSGSPVLCLHGFLDNCAIFTKLSEHFTSPSFLIDLPGHGLSDFVAKSSFSYSIIESALYLKELKDSLWPNIKISLVGHSLGAIIASVFSSMFHEDVEKLVLIDAITPIPAKGNSKLADNASLFVETKNTLRQPSFFNSKELAVKARVHSGVNTELATQLANRSVLKNSHKKFSWRYDPKLKLPSIRHFRLEESIDIIKNIQCPSLFIESKRNSSPFLPLNIKKNFQSLVHVKTEEEGHYAVFYKPDYYGELINQFLN